MAFTVVIFWFFVLMIGVTVYAFPVIWAIPLVLVGFIEAFAAPVEWLFTMGRFHLGHEAYGPAIVTAVIAAFVLYFVMSLRWGEFFNPFRLREKPQVVWSYRYHRRTWTEDN